MQAMGVVIDIVPWPEAEGDKKKVKLVCHTLASALLVVPDQEELEEGCPRLASASAKRPSSSLR